MSKLNENDLETILKKFQNEAIATYKEMEKNKEYPFPSILPVGLFNCLKHGKLETDYTRTLAYLLDEKEKHDYGNKFMKALCKKLEIKALTNYTVCPEKCCENGRYDIFISGKSGNKDCVIVIEAKIDSYEGENQLGKYNKDLKKYGTEIKKIFLTVDEETPSQKDWENWTWQDIIDMLWSVIQYKKNQTQAGYYFCKYFISSIYSNIYDLDDNNISLYNSLHVDEREEYAEKIEKHTINNEIFIKYPSALDTLYDYTSNESEFDRSYEKCDRQLRGNIKQIWDNVARGINKTISDKAPVYWNKYIAIKKQTYLNIGVKIIVTKKKEEKLYWFYNIHFDGANRFDLLQKVQEELREQDKARNIPEPEVKIPLPGANILLGAKEYNGESDLQSLSKEIIERFRTVLDLNKEKDIK